MIVLTRK